MHPSQEDPSAEAVRLAATLVQLQSQAQRHFSHTDARSRLVPAAWDQPGAGTFAQLQQIATSLNADLIAALESGDFHYEYQPIIEATTGAIEYYEALVRWQREDRIVPPSQFLPVAEETGVMADIQQYLLADVQRFYSSLPSPISISLNWSPGQLADSRAVSVFLERMQDLKIDPERVVIEITERSMMFRPEKAHNSIVRLKEAGYSIALDDFGHGYCGFQYLRCLPIDLIKMDGSLINDLRYSVRSVALLRGITDIARGMGILVVAEGVETHQQMNVVRQAGCDYIQGYLTGRPQREPHAATSRTSTRRSVSAEEA